MAKLCKFTGGPHDDTLIGISDNKQHFYKMIPSDSFIFFLILTTVSQFFFSPTPTLISFSFGDLGCESFEIVHGIVHVCIPNTNNDPNYPNKIVNTLRPGDTFGQFAQSHNGFRTATCVAKGKTRLRVVSIADSSNGLKYQSLLPVLKDTNNDRQIAEIPSVNTTTSSSVLLHRQIAEIPIQNFEELVFNNGASIIRQGDHGDSFYIIKAGLVDVVISNDSNNFIQGCCLVNQLASGQVFGTRALTSGTGIRTAHCISRAKTTVLKYLATPLILSQNVEIRQMLQRYV